MPLTDKQKKELNIGILEYLRDNGYAKSLECFLEESKEELPNNNLKILERKWTAVIRLTAKVHDLESKLIETENELKVAKPFNYNSFKGPKKLFDELLPNKQKYHMKGHQKAINQVVFHPNYSWLVTCGDDSKIGVWDYETGKLEKWLRGHTNSVCDVGFNPNGTYLASCSVDMSVKIWNFEDEFRCEKTLNGHDHAVSGVAFLRHNDNLLISCSRDGSVKIWELESGYCIKTLSDVHDGEWVKRVEISYDGSLLATCSVDKTLRVFDIKKDYGEIGIYRGHEHVVEEIRFSNPNTDEIILHDAIRTVKKKRNTSYDEDSEESDDSDEYEESDESDDDGMGLMTNATKQVKPPRFIASASRDKAIIIWDIKSTQCIMKLIGHENWVRSLVFHPCGRFLISSADDKSIRCWDLSKRRLYSKIDKCHTGFISSIDWHPTESLLASVSTSKDVKIWYHDKHCHEETDF
eukprot:15343_1